MLKSLLYLYFILFFTTCSHLNFKQAYVVKEYEIPKALLGKKTDYFVDVVIVHTTHSQISWQHLQKEFQVAQETFLKQGVYLNLKRAVKLNIPQGWHYIKADRLEGKQDNSLEFYDRLLAKEKWLSKRAQKIFNQMIHEFENKERTVFLVTLNDVYMGVFEKDKKGSFYIKNFKVGGFSFPPYIYQNRIPKHLRGVISLGYESKKKSMIAHELAHKLINASHEGGATCPRFSGKTIPGILGYSGSVEILSGKDGRYHGERLRRSPFVYKKVNGKKVWNKGYINRGGYRDQIYGPYHITPSCKIDK